MFLRGTRCFSSTAKIQKVAANNLPRSLADAISRGAPIDIHPEVADALAAGKPVVALETTIVTHGMPYPVNLSTALSVEANVRKSGAIPATIGLLGGRAHIGLSKQQLEQLADLRSGAAIKTSRRDISAVMALKKNGGTTCSATLIFAALAGIKFFATGGLGGVHRAGENSMDVSADLPELARCPVGLVSAGIKSILDIGRTLEYLETLGVPVVSYGSPDFPAFYSRKSGFKSPWSIETPEQAASILYHQWTLGMAHGALFGVPIPPAYEQDGQELQNIVEAAVKESEANGMSKRGKEVTPWLLQRIGELSDGRSLKSNIALIENTAAVAGEMAVAYSAFARHNCSRGIPRSQGFHHNSIANVDQDHSHAILSPRKREPATLVVVGSSAIDVTSRALSASDDDKQSTSPGAITTSLGGVGRNIAEAAHRVSVARSPEFGSATALVSSVGDDLFGRLLKEEMQRLGMRTDSIITGQNRTAACNMILDSNGGLVGGVADMDIIKALGDNALDEISKHSPRIVCMDGNLSSELLISLVDFCNRSQIASFFEPTSVAKSVAIIPAINATWTDSRHSPITFASPNILELKRLYHEIVHGHEAAYSELAWKTIDRFALGSEYRASLERLARQSASDGSNPEATLQFLVTDGIAQMAVNLLPVFQHLIVKCGSFGVFLSMRIQQEDIPAWAAEHSDSNRRQVVAHGDGEIIVLKHVPAPFVSTEQIVNVTGAGDSLVGTLLSLISQNPATLRHPQTLDNAMNVAQKAAILTLQSSLAVSPLLSSQLY